MRKAVASLLRKLDQRNPYGFWSLDTGTRMSRLCRLLEGRTF
jgi:hypothetical protein